MPGTVLGMYLGYSVSKINTQLSLNYLLCKIFIIQHLHMISYQCFYYLRLKVFLQVGELSP